MSAMIYASLSPELKAKVNIGVELVGIATPKKLAEYVAWCQKVMSHPGDYDDTTLRLTLALWERCFSAAVQMEAGDNVGHA